MKWKYIDFDEDDFYVRNAYRDFCIYNDDGELIGHERGDCDLKNDVSYRTIPLNQRLKQQLLIHRERQQELFKKLRIKWDEDCYVFLNRYHKPYVSDNLSKGMKRFIDKHNFQHMTPYGLRHSFATFWSQNGMEPEVLKAIMGHSKYETTLRYYVAITKRRKKEAMKIKVKTKFKKRYKLKRKQLKVNNRSCVPSY